MSEVSARIDLPPVRSGRPPGPRGLRLVRTLLDYRRNNLPTIEKLAREFGDIAYMPFPGGGGFVVSHPDYIQHILIRNSDNYRKTSATHWVRHFFGNAMQINNGEYARNMRRIIAPAFHGEGLARAYAELIVDESVAAIRGWKPGPRPGITQELTELVLDVIVRIFFGTEPGAETRRVGALFVAALPPAGAILPRWIRGSRSGRYVAAAAALTAEVMARIAARRRDVNGGTDFLSMLVRAGKDGQQLNDQQIRDEIVAYALAGYSAATALNQILRLVAENPHADTRLAAELETVIGAREPRMQDLPALDYLGSVVKEALRLCPPAGMMFRRAAADDVIGGWPIPAGARMFLSSWVVQRDRRFFPDPLTFKPERWTPEFERALPMCAYFPFGRGPRACIGGAMGELILQLIVATILRRHRLEARVTLRPDQDEWPAILAAGGIQVDVHPR
ncbi:MAG TPA: cytochrome P450 [Thermoanaerobaculia bacterium]